MNTFDAILVGVLIAVLLGVLAYLFEKAWKLLNALIGSLSSLATLAGQIVRVMTTIQQELAFMRSLTGVTNLPASSPPPESGQAPAVATPPAHPSYPDPFLSRFPVVVDKASEPDAEKDDTDLDLINQTPEELAAAGVLEELRQRGMDVEDSDVVHPGVEADAE